MLFDDPLICYRRAESLLMKTLVVILSISLAAMLAAISALWWRLRWHLRRSRSDEALKSALAQIEPVEKINVN